MWQRLQDLILSIPQGITRLMDMLAEREVYSLPYSVCLYEVDEGSVQLTAFVLSDILV